MKAPVFAFGYAEAGKGIEGLSCVAAGEEGRRINKEPAPVEDLIKRGRTWF